jgi:glucosamine-6-phosphate isomerase
MGESEKMKVEVVDSYQALSQKAAEMIIKLVQQEPEALVIFPSGDTPRGTYRRLVAVHQAGGVDLSRLTVMALDEWGGRSRRHPLSCHQMIATSFVERVGIPPERFLSLDGAAADPEAECHRYEVLLSSGRPVLSLLGLGPNGHIALNEPALSLSVKTHVVPLAQTTLARAEEEMVGQAVASYGLTLGMPQIMSAVTILLLASGPHKATAVQAMFSGLITTECPASLLHLHPNVQVILDEAAAGISAFV